jgi:predicted RNase H-like HicB family nuclease
VASRKVKERETYTVRCRREPSGWWFVEVPDVEGGYTQARRLDQVEYMVRDLLSLLLDVPEDSFDVIVEPEIPGPLSAEIEKARELRRTAEVAHEAASEAVWRAVSELGAAQFSIRDIGQLLRLSHQRISQLMAPSSPPTLPTTRATTRRATVAATAAPRRTGSRRSSKERPKTPVG